tara:strand:+ start:141 stop:488 length:348 start_codon:yes stop_codon:yes gene_type:complete
MSILNRKKLQKIILQEFKMIGMTNGDAGFSPMKSLVPEDEYHISSHDHGCESDGEELLPMHTSPSTPIMGSSSGTVSRESCCAAVMAMIECCSCETTKRAIIECCQDILAGDYDY